MAYFDFLVGARLEVQVGVLQSLVVFGLYFLKVPERLLARRDHGLFGVKVDAPVNVREELSLIVITFLFYGHCLVLEVLNGIPAVDQVA